MYKRQHLSLEIFLVIVLIKISWYKIFGLYEGMWRYTSIWDLINIIKSNIISSIFLVNYIFFIYGFQDFGRSFLVIDLIICTGLISISRVGIRFLFLEVKSFFNPHSYNSINKRVVIIGAGHTGHAISREAIQKLKFSIKIVGFIDDDQKKINRKINGIPIVGKITDLPNFCLLYTSPSPRD